MGSGEVKYEILYIPAWWPCSFFKEQQDALADTFEPIVLIGKCRVFSRRNFIKNFFQKDLGGTRGWKEGELFHFDFNWVNVDAGQADIQLSILAQKAGVYIKEILQDRRLDLVYIQSVSDLSVVIACWARHCGIPVVLAEHILFIRRSNDYLSRRKEKLFSEVDSVLCVSNYLYRNLLTSDLSPKSVEVVGNLVDVEFVSTNNHHDKNGKVLFVASHLADKDFDTFLRAVKLLPKDIHVDVIGLDNDVLYGRGRSLHDIVTELGLVEQVSFMGKMNHEDLIRCYASYSVLLSTSRSETFGLSVAEALSCGTFAVCTDSGGIHDFMTEKDGKIVNIGDAKALADAVMEAIRNKKRATGEVVKEKFAKDPYVKKIKNVLSELVQNKSL